MSGISPITPTPVSFGCGNLDFISTLLLKSFQNDNKISTSFDLIPLYILNYSYTLLIIYLFLLSINQTPLELELHEVNVFIFLWFMDENDLNRNLDRHHNEHYVQYPSYVNHFLKIFI